MKELKHIRDLLYKNRLKYVFGIICIIIVDCLQLLLPQVFKQLTNSLTGGTVVKQDLFWFAVVILSLAAGIALFRFCWRYLVFGAARRIEADLRCKLYAHLQKLSASYYNAHKTGDLMAHATNDIENIRMAVGQGITMAVDSTLIPVVAIIMMFSTAGPQLTLVSFIPLIVLAAVLTVNIRFMYSRIQKMQEAFSSLTEAARENFSGIRVVKSFAQERHQIEKFREANAQNREMNLKYAWNMSLLFPMIISISAIAFAITLGYGGMLVIERKLTLGNFVAFNSYLAMMTWPIAALGWISNLFQRGFVSLQRVNVILDEVPEIESISGQLDVPLNGRIEFKNLTFTYPGTDLPVLKDISAVVEAGKTLAIVGRTGSGKTSLANLIPRLFNTEPGTLLIDGRDIHSIPLSTLRNGIGYVPQDTVLFSTTIRENIDFWRGLPDEIIEAASKTARVFDDICSFPDGFSTLVGERGITLSGGQKQRIAIARALISTPAILILDDCLSAVDTHTEEEILKGLKDVMKHRTCVIISHRLSTIKEADEILLLDEGAVLERGTHESLLELQGAYFELYQKQLLSEQIEEEE